MNLIKPFLLLFIFCNLYSSSKGIVSQNTRTNKQPNILFIAIDDLRPDLGCYGNKYVKSPNIDKLAETGTVFTNHFVSVPTCGASRYSLLTGMLPKTKGYLSNEACRDFISGKAETEEPETFIHYLKSNGYYTVGVGKISHYVDGLLYGYNDSVGTNYELPHSWDEMLFNAGKWQTGWNAFFAYADGSNRQSRNYLVKPYEKGNVDDEGYPDGLTAKLALQKLRELKEKEQPFFLGIGFFKPHLPFNSPSKYWDLYNERDLPLSPVPFIPKNINKASLHSSEEFNRYKLGDEFASLDGPISENYERKLRHAYFACVSYIDAQIGRVLNELRELELEDNTIVILWGDHGWHLGDQLVWGKHTIFEHALKSPLIIKIPGKRKGLVQSNIVSTIDIYPTITELCGLDMPHVTDGKSLVPIIEDQIKNWSNNAYSYYNKGISLRTERYRLTKYFREQKPVIELYDHKIDPNETKNIAEENPEIIEKLMPLLEKENNEIYK